MGSSKFSMSRIRRYCSLRPKLFVALGLFVVLTAGGAWQYHRWLHPRPNITFGEYAPSWLPPGIRIKTIVERVDIQDHYNTPSFRLDLSGNGSVVMGKNDAHFQPGPTYACPPPDNSDICKPQTTIGGQQYLYTLQQGYGVDHQTMVWSKGNTKIVLALQTKPGQAYSKKTIDKVVDSFVSTHFKHLPVEERYRMLPFDSSDETCDGGC